MPKIKNTSKKPKQIEDYDPGSTKKQVFEVLHKVATTKVNPKPDSKKRS